ncbi:hypothetical protein DPEC_G00094090 [Dallia pectoralis]|uniref:Uncharacterized protein n=1 Tax=Dallia pectoralis TaxID=75939 RepID=A0ACC2H162_DALPE|nr:hypothetical protein DPEC_G00094090 [Dallia pectoralis]
MAVTPGSMSTPASCPPKQISGSVCQGTTVADTHAVSAGTACSAFLPSPFPDEDCVEERIDSRVVRQRQQSLRAEGGGALFPSPLAIRKTEESGRSGLMHSLRLHGQYALSEITRPMSGVDKVIAITGFTPVAGVPQLSVGDSSSAHGTTSSGFSQAESAGGSSDVTAGLVFHRPPSCLPLSPVVLKRRVESRIPFEGSSPWAVPPLPADGSAAERARTDYDTFLTNSPQLCALPHSEHYSEWRRNCSLFTWLDQTIRRGYAVQFLCAPPPFSGVVETVIRSEEKVTALLSEIANLREKGAIDIVPRDQRERGFYPPYFLVPKKTGEMRPILDLRILNRWVSKWPFRMLTKETYLGLFLDTGIMRARLSDERIESILSALRLCRPPCRRRVQEIISLLGLMSAAHAVVTLGLLHMHALQRWFARRRVDPVRHRRRILIIPYTLAGDLDYWRNPAVLERGVPLGRVSAVTQVFTDASLTGWGGMCQGQAVGGVWPRSQRHINLLELETVQLVLTHFAPRLRGRDVLIRSDNRATVAYINRQGGVRSPELHEATTRLWFWAHRHLRSLSAVLIPGKQNVGADLRSRGGP